jgi:hypothetical protein
MPWLGMIPWKIVGVVVAVLAIWGYGYWGGVNHEREKQLAQAAKALEAAVAVEKARGQATLEVERMAWAKTQVVKENTRTIVKVIRDEKPSSNCSLSNGWVQRHNEASANTLPKPPSVDHEGDSGVTADKALEQVAENYGTCHEIREIAKGCQQWIREQSQIKQ